jgi:uncharacterized membrane protein YkoI
MKTFLSTILFSALLLTFNMAVDAQAKMIGMKRAQEIAVRRAEGLKLKHKALEHENGRSFYEFDFKNWDGSIRKVNVDAYSGAIISVVRQQPWDKKK